MPTQILIIKNANSKKKKKKFKLHITPFMFGQNSIHEYSKI
jgi:hypothetical protein